jgi:hypothetical protein
MKKWHWCYDDYKVRAHMKGLKEMLRLLGGIRNTSIDPWIRRHITLSVLSSPDPSYLYHNLSDVTDHETGATTKSLAALKRICSYSTIRKKTEISQHLSQL